MTHRYLQTLDIDADYIQKTSYYNTPDISAYAKRVTNRTKVVFSSSCKNWRGVPSTHSANDLLAIGLTKKEIEILRIDPIIIFIIKIIKASLTSIY